jgi:ABC-type uncharacterized transport system permease subunit
MESRNWVYFLLIPITLVLAVFLLWPFVLVLWESLFSEGRLSLVNYTSLFIKPLYRESLFTSLVLSVSTALIGTIIGIPLSYVLYKSGGKSKGILMTINAIPLTFSGLVVGFSFIVLLGSSGFITLLLKKFVGIDPLEFSAFLFTWRGLMVAYLYFLIPRMILTMISAWSNADWTLLEAAASLGAGPFTILFKILIPMLGPAILAGSSLLFAVSMGAYGTAFALTGVAVKILPLVIFTHVSDLAADIEKADALAVVLAFVTTGVIVLYEQFFSRRLGKR